MVGVLNCPSCEDPIPERYWNEAGNFCRRCGLPVMARVYPAAFRDRARAVVESVEDGAEASCFYHASNKATAPCGHCGRFVCAVCDIEINGVHMCPACLESGASSKTIAALESRRVLYDSVALCLATWPVLTIYLPLFTGPVAVYLAIRYWNAPLGLVRRSRWRFVVAGLLGAVEFLGLIGLIVLIVWTARSS
jgi:hypothetical protein